MQIEVTKLYKGRIDIRDYIVKKCIDSDESCVVKHKKDLMTLTPKQLKSDVVAISKEMSSKFDNKKYKLLSYMWEPDEVTL